MNFDADRRVKAYTDLSAGDEIEAWYGGRLSHRGPITVLAPAGGMFWITDHCGGGRKMLDLEDLLIVRVLPPRQSPAGANPEPTAA